MDDENMKELLAKQLKPIKQLVFSGGGCKGDAYPYALKALEEYNILSGVEAIAGSSAGAMTAFVAACGVSGEAVKRAMFKEIPLEHRNKTILQKLMIRKEISEIRKEVAEDYEIMTSLVNESILGYLDNLPVIDTCEILVNQINEKIGTDGGKHEIDKLARRKKALEVIIQAPQKVTDIKNKIENNGKITFVDLEILHILNPEKFKSLHVTATHKNTGESAIFNLVNTPDITIDLACKASSALPIMLEAVKINGEEDIDGGYRDNTPIDVFSGRDNGRILTFVFGVEKDQNDPAYKAVYSQKNPIFPTNIISGFLMNDFFKWMLGVGVNFKYFKDQEKIYQSIRDHAPDVVILDTGIATSDFEVANLKSDIIDAIGYIGTARWICNNYGYEDCFKDPKLVYREFILDVCNKVFGKIIANPGKHKVNDINLMTKHCMEESWQKVTMVKFISRVAVMGYLDEVVKELNKTTTSLKIIEMFLEILGCKDIENPFSYEFTQENLQNGIKNAIELSKNQDFIELVNIKGIDDIMTCSDKDNEFFTLSTSARLKFLAEKVGFNVSMQDVFIAVEIVDKDADLDISENENKIDQLKDSFFEDDENIEETDVLGGIDSLFLVPGP